MHIVLVNGILIHLLISQKNKRYFLVFVIMGALTSFVGGTTAVQSMWLEQLSLAILPLDLTISKHLFLLQDYGEVSHRYTTENHGLNI